MQTCHHDAQREQSLTGPRPQISEPWGALRGSEEELPFLFFGEEDGQAFFLHSLLELLPCKAIRKERIVENCRCTKCADDFQNPPLVGVFF